MIKTGNILIAGSKKPIWNKLLENLTETGHNVKSLSEKNNIPEELMEQEFEVILVHPHFPGVTTNGFLQTVKNIQPFAEIVVLAEDGSMRDAFDFMRKGAYDYLNGPVDVEKVTSVTQRAVEQAAKAKGERSTHKELSRRSISYDLVGESQAMKDVSDMIYKVSPTNSSILIQGETGSGKGLIAESIHHNSYRPGSSPIMLNCGAIPENLLESELFGYEKGAFTGATHSKPGILETANGGTLFLDEIGELKHSLQSKLLQVLETGRFRRLGGTRETQVDTRIISATNKNLSENGSESQFRRDLYYRLSVITITVPPLRERPDDIPALANYFLDNLKISGKGRKTISDGAMKTMQNYNWPGNVRELRNVIERLIILTSRDTIEVADLPPVIQKYETAAQLFMFPREDKHFSLNEMEKIYIEQVLDHCRGHRTQTAKILGITRTTLYNKLKLFGLAANNKEKEN